MPATAAIDNETLDHLLSVVDDSPNLEWCLGISRAEIEMGRWRRVLAGASLAWIVGTGSLGAQELVPWREGTVRPKADAGFRWMPAEGGFARQQGLALEMVTFE